MTDPTKTPDTTTKSAKGMTAAESAKLVKRPVLVAGEKGGEPTVKLVAVKEAEVLSHKDYGTHVVVVTTDGQKFSSAEA
ncbi:MAG: hypothetical protein Q8R98_17950 [Rubrivivax sp.]|nr:hypothetical protein [Rubrivivax sp.]MDP3613726.1 hypothetical protein [Rubrivivax sp.]